MCALCMSVVNKEATYLLIIFIEYKESTLFTVYVETLKLVDWGEVGQRPNVGVQFWVTGQKQLGNTALYGCEYFAFCEARLLVC